ncbi:YggT family protein [Irregularibacter muris]|uniref:YggT family protein n=1 Tax=Irregularibacter muris TaxID=1796619 RepID=A0AAE3KZE7_9FIRM|nr:YggT family protein [Irregularibacter muris]MCR1898187.1 YggT family protein [Irregularibacter muris]
MSLQYTLLRAGNYLFEFINILILIHVIFSWVRPNPNNNIVRLIYNLTEPILAPFRNLSHRLNIGGGMIDFSPLFALLVIQFLIQPLYQRIVFLIF